MTRIPRNTAQKSRPDRFHERRNRLLRALKRNRLTAILVTDPINVHYLTGFLGDDSWCLVTPATTLLLTDSRFADQVELDCPGLDCDIRKPAAASSIAVQSAKAIQSLKLDSVAFELASLTVASFEEIRTNLKSATLVGTNGMIEELRLIKDRNEIAAIRAAVKTAEKAFQTIVTTRQPGCTEKFVADQLNLWMRMYGGQESSFETIVAAGPRAALPHARPSQQVIEDDQILLIDWGVRQNLYNSDLTRTLYLGKPTTRFAKIYATVLSAQRAAIESIRPGVTSGQVDSVARKVIEDAGFGRYFGHGLGHGIGLRVHEGPRVRPNADTVLRRGMVVTVEPGIYQKGWGGVRIEDDVLVTRTGHLVLSSLPKQLDEIIIQSW